MAKTDLNFIESKSIKARIILVAVVILGLVFGWIAVRSQLGNMLAELSTANDPNAAIIADLSHGLAPSDPVTMWLKASLEKNIFTPEKTDSAVRMFEETVRLSPDDFRWWIELGRAYDQAEKPAQAESAFKHAVELAPTYTFPHWQLGNFYLRQGHTDEAFAELKKATENNQIYREQVFSLAWEYFDKDPAKIEQLAADWPDVHASLALFYAQRGRATDALRIWNLLDDGQKLDYGQISRAMAQGLYERHYYPEALEFARQLGIDPDAKPETITNGGFEKPIGNAVDTNFGWHVTRNDAKIDVATDSTVRHEGAKSLRIVFKNYIKPDLYAVGQNVVVVPGRSYKVHFWLRTESLKSGGMPQLQVINANNDKIITLSAPFPTGTNDWQEISIDFTAPGDCNGIVILTVRGFCGENCPLAGTIWYDDFGIVKQ